MSYKYVYYSVSNSISEFKLEDKTKLTFLYKCTLNIHTLDLKALSIYALGTYTPDTLYTDTLATATLDYIYILEFSLRKKL